MAKFFENIFLLSAMFVACSLNISASVGDVYIKVEKEAELHDGDQVIVASMDYGMCMSRYMGATYVKPCVLSFSNVGKVATLLTDSVQVFTLKRSVGAWSLFADDKGWLYAPSVYNSNLEYVATPVTTSGKKKTTMLDMDFDAMGNAIVKFRVSDYPFLKYKDDTHRFARYKYSDSHGHVQIYRKAATNKVLGTLSLGENGGNIERLEDNIDARVKALHVERDFIADGGFYSICLPVSMSEKDIDDCFCGACFYRLVSVEYVDDAKFMFYFKRTYTLTAGTPYLMRPMNDILAPVLKDMLIGALAPGRMSFDTSVGKCHFVGVFDPVRMPSSGSVVFVGRNGDKLVTPNKVGQLNGLRAYIELPVASPSTGFSVEDIAGNSRVLIMDDVTDEIDVVVESKMNGTLENQVPVYSIDGVFLGHDIDVLGRGVYIYGGKKIILK